MVYVTHQKQASRSLLHSNNLSALTDSRSIPWHRRVAQVQKGQQNFQRLPQLVQVTNVVMGSSALRVCIYPPQTHNPHELLAAGVRGACCSLTSFRTTEIIPAAPRSHHRTEPPSGSNDLPGVHPLPPHAL